MKKIITNSPEQTQNLGKKFATLLDKGDVVAFEGGLGAGKTAFIRGMSEGLEVTGEVCSPTYSLVNEYRGKSNLYHFDMYRIQNMEDVYSTGFFDYLDCNDIIAVEWSENITNALPKNTIVIKIEVIDENTRSFTIDGDERFENFSD
jgi:tRNA threonylcarbamoyladenosine biosynthesis protein TsaE